MLNTDFNALRTLRLVYQLGSFSKAADELEVKQSTVSYAIDRLRKVLDDPLIIRQGMTNVPTQRCLEIIPVIDRILAEVEGLERQGPFDPSRSTAHFTMITATFGLRVVLSRVLQRIHTEAPGIRVNVLERYQGVAEHLQEGKADLALTVTNVEASGIYSKPGLLEDFAVCLMDGSHPLVGKKLTHEELQEAKIVVSRIWANWVQPFEVTAKNLGIQIDPAITVTNPAHLPILIEGSDMITVLPSSLARTYSDRLGTAALPFHSAVSLNLHWPAAANRSPANIWLRDLIADVCQSIESERGAGEK